MVARKARASCVRPLLLRGRIIEKRPRVSRVSSTSEHMYCVILPLFVKKCQCWLYCTLLLVLPCVLLDGAYEQLFDVYRWSRRVVPSYAKHILTTFLFFSLSFHSFL